QGRRIHARNEATPGNELLGRGRTSWKRHDRCDRVTVPGHRQAPATTRARTSALSLRNCGTVTVIMDRMYYA
ncbi:MAG: hypothetical protein WBP39_09505, partial [Candidatus Phosphoribacter baldrii]